MNPTVEPERAPRGKVVFVAPVIPDLSGGATAVVTLAGALREQGRAVEIVSVAKGRGFAELTTRTIFRWDFLSAKPVLRTPGQAWWTLLWRLPLLALKRVVRPLSLWRLRHLIDQLGREDVVIFTHATTRSLLDEAGHRRSVDGPLFLAQHHSSFGSLHHEPWLREAVLAGYERVDALVCLTPDDAQAFDRLLAIPVHAIANPVPATRHHALVDQPLAVAVTRMSDEKQIDLMVRCFAEMSASPDRAAWRLMLHGVGPALDEIRRLVDELGAGERIRLMGATDSPAEVFARASLNLLTSKYEGMPMAVLEAAAAGVVTLAFDCAPGVRELVHDSRYLVPADDAGAFAARLRTVTGDLDQLRSDGSLARVRSEQYSPSRIAARWTDLIEDCQRRRRQGGTLG